MRSFIYRFRHLIDWLVVTAATAMAYYPGMTLLQQPGQLPFHMLMLVFFSFFTSSFAIISNREAWQPVFGFKNVCKVKE
jgi:hypothetical protein